ncbi:hypothetical protein [Planctobacterium marinum]|uniref:TPR repeat protein n=1 Tax=Planctobacterium marinum TaxID=1631968 RepID=A0AA48HHQ8_9ALTE|nr:hypothetical protein MACH26_04070 [Planctobacterium marinum]
MILNSKTAGLCNYTIQRRVFVFFKHLSLLFLFYLCQTSHILAQTADNPVFAAALAHIEKEELQQAEGLLKYMLADAPDMHRARLELGLIYLKLQKTQQAQAQFEILLNHPDVPEAVKQNINRLMANKNIANQKAVEPPSPNTSDTHPTPAITTAIITKNKHNKHHFSGELQLSAGYDDNVRFSSADYFIEDDPFLDGLFLETEEGELIYVAPDGFIYDLEGNLLYENDGLYEFTSLDSSNAFVEGRLKLNHQYQFADDYTLTWHNSLLLQTTDNQQHPQYNKTQMRLETGITWQTAETWKWSVFAHHRLLERDGQVQIRATELRPQVTYYNAWGSWELGLSWMGRQYEDSVIVTDDIETWYYGFSSTIREVSLKWSKLYYNNKLLLLTRLDYSDNNADDDLDYKGLRLTFASVYDFAPDWSLLLSATRFNQDYSDSIDEPLDDTSTSLRGKLTYQLNDSTSLFLSTERAFRDSDVYGGIKSDKSLIQIGAELRF